MKNPDIETYVEVEVLAGQLRRTGLPGGWGGVGDDVLDGHQLEPAIGP